LLAAPLTFSVGAPDTSGDPDRAASGFRVQDARVATPRHHEIHWLIERRKSTQFGEHDE
jgi:hypothetical protein